VIHLLFIIVKGMATPLLYPREADDHFRTPWAEIEKDIKTPNVCGMRDDFCDPRPDVPNISSIQADSKCHVIKCLQEQLHQLTSERLDSESLVSRCQIAEQALKMQEAEFKLKLEDAEDELIQLREENERLRRFAMKSKSQVRQARGRDTDATYLKYAKWKRKYKALAESDSDHQAAAEVSSLQSKLSAMSERLTQAVQQTESERDESNKLKLQMAKTEADLRRTKGTISESSSKIQKLQAEIADLQGTNRRLESSRQQKSDLLHHTRAKREKDMRAKKQADASMQSELDSQKKNAADQSAEVARLTIALERERKETRRLGKELAKLKRQSDSAIADIQMQLSGLQEENQAQKQQIDEYKENSSALEANLSGLQTRKTELESKVKKASKVQQQNASLKEAVADLTAKLEALQAGAASSADDTATKLSEIRSILSPTGRGPATWGEVLGLVHDFVTKHATETEETKRKHKEFKRVLRERDTAATEANQMVQKLREENDELLQRLRQAQQDLSDLRDKPRDPTVHFIGAVRKRIDRNLYEVQKKVEVSLALLHGSELPPRPSMRELVLFAFFAIHWTHFKRSDPPDSAVIGEFASPKSGRPKLTETVSEVCQRLHSFEARAESDARSICDAQSRIEVLENELKEAKSKAALRDQQNSELSQNCTIAQRKAETMVSPTKYSGLQARYEEKIAEHKELEWQVQSLKHELSRVLDGLDNRGREQSELQLTLNELTEENEQLKQALARLTHEFELLQAALKDKTREVLALERQLIRHKTQVVVVKDHLPIGEMHCPRKAESRSPTSDFYVSESVRKGLTQMQDRMMRQEKLI
jgi:chromosome segregation ATPase